MENKKLMYTGYILSFLLILIASSVTADDCTLSASIINQDPYPALPGDYVEILFQITGVGGACEDGAAIDLILEYPFSLDSGTTSRSIESSTYVGQGYNSNWNAIYTLRVDENAIPGDYTIELRYKSGSTLNWNTYLFKKFNITVEGGKTDFEIHVDNYKIKENQIIFEILNVGNQDIEALTVEIPKQDNIIIKGSNRNIVGSLDANEYTTASFEATPSEGEILLNLYYTDTINERRLIKKSIYYEPNYFLESNENIEPSRVGTYVTFVVVGLFVVLFFVRRHKNKKKQNSKKKFEI